MESGMSGPDNPHAFPRQLDGDELGICHTQYGMTLRDWFAGQYVSGIHAGGAIFRDPQNVAEEAFAIADAMLAERQRTSPTTSTQGAAR
jgi:hypothetical protein